VNNYMTGAHEQSAAGYSTAHINAMAQAKGLPEVQQPELARLCDRLARSCVHIGDQVSDLGALVSRCLGSVPQAVAALNEAPPGQSLIASLDQYLDRLEAITEEFREQMKRLSRLG
jgi:hypothetical protein